MEEEASEQSPTGAGTIGMDESNNDATNSKPLVDIGGTASAAPLAGPATAATTGRSSTDIDADDKDCANASTSGTTANSNSDADENDDENDGEERYISMTQEMIAWDDGEDEVDLRRLIFRSPVPGGVGTGGAGTGSGSKGSSKGGTTPKSGRYAATTTSGGSGTRRTGSGTPKTGRSTGSRGSSSGGGSGSGRKLRSRKKRRSSSGSACGGKDDKNSSGSITTSLPPKNPGGLFGKLDDAAAMEDDIGDLPTQERSNVTESAQKKQKQTIPASKEDEKTAPSNAIAANAPAEAGSRRRLRRMNSHDSTTSSSSSRMITSLRHPTAMKDIIEETGEGGLTADVAARKKRGRPTGVSDGAAASLYGKENNRLDGDDKSKKIKRQALGEASKTASTRPEASAMEAGGKNGKGNNETDNDDADPFEDLLQELEEDGHGATKSPMPTMRQQIQQRQRLSSAKKRYDAKGPTLSLSQPNPYNKATSASVPKPVVATRRPSSAPTLTSKYSAAYQKPSSSSLTAQRNIRPQTGSGFPPSSAPPRSLPQPSIVNITTKTYAATHSSSHLNAMRQQNTTALLPQAARKNQSSSVPKSAAPTPLVANATTSPSLVSAPPPASLPVASVPTNAVVATVTSAAVASEPTKAVVAMAPPKMAVEHSSNSGVDDLLGGIDFTDDVFAAMDNLVDAKQESQVSTVPSVAAPSTINNAAAMDPAQNISSTSASAAAAPASNDDFGAFPEVDFDAIDSAVGRRSLDTSASTNATSGEHLRQAQPQQQQQPIAANEKSEFGDFPELDFDAMDQLVQQKGHFCQSSSVASSSVQVPQKQSNHLAVPPPHLPVHNQAVSTATNASLGPAFISFDRYKVVAAEEDLSTYTRTLKVAHWNSSRESGDENDSNNTPSTTSATPLGRVDGCIHLRGEWYHTQCEPDDTVHLCSLSGRYQTGPSALPVMLHTAPPQGSDSNDDLVLIVHPDTLLTPTAISETVTCVRRAVLKTRLGSSGLSSEAAIVGTMRHDLFERCMQERNFSDAFAQQNVDQIVRSHSDTLVGCQFYDDAIARDQVLRVMPQVRQFAAKYCAFGPAPTQNTLPGARKSSKLQGHGFQSDIDFAADAVYATEEAAISPELGLKGFVDATLATSTSPCAQTQHYGYGGGGGGGGQNTRAPLMRSLMGVELKTGHRQNPQNEHMAQLALYTLMLRMRRGSAALGNSGDAQSRQLSECAQRHLALQNGAAAGGMLLYLNHESYVALHVSPILSEVKSLIGQRNVLAVDTRKATKPRGVVTSYGDEKDGGSGKASKITILPAPPAQLPEMASPQGCIRCYSNRECMMYAASDTANAPAVQRTHGTLMNHYTGHLSQVEMQYFLDWDRMVDLESRAGRHDIAKAWLKSSQERERNTGKTFSDLVFATSVQLGQELTPSARACPSNTDGEKMILRFDRAPGSPMTTPLNSLKIENKSHVVLSTDGVSLRPSERHGGAKVFRHQMNVFRGIVESVSDRNVSILASRNDLLQVQDLMSLWQESSPSSSGTNDYGSALRFRLDKDDIATGTGTLRQNLIKLFTVDVPTFKQKRKQDGGNNGNGPNDKGDVDSRLQRRMPWLRRAIIQMDPPQFDITSKNSMFDPTCFKGAPIVKGCQFDQLSTQYASLNVDQKHAVDRVVSAKDYAIIQGYPGTGKTMTIAFVACLLAAQGKRVLITSYTHAAVDNLLMKLLESGVHGNEHLTNASDLIRIGTKSSCHPDVHPILAHQVALNRENISCGKPSASVLYQIISAARIVGCTALTVPRTPLLAKQHFDVVIIDEAGQISQPAIIGALMAADSFVLVGDHMQLPPLVADDAAEQAGYGVSMLKRLAEQHSDAVAKLTLQYRMHENICSLCNEIVYKGELKCASDEVRRSKLVLSRYPRAVPVPIHQEDDASTERGWLQSVLNPDVPAVFIDTDAIGSGTNGAFQGLERSSGRRQGGTIVNDTEIALTRSIVRCLLKCGLNSGSIGVICPYRSQLRLLDDDKFLHRMKKTGLEISTIDRYQGRDKSAIVLSLVRSNAEGKCGRLLEDFRRLNVAVSRAKRKLIIIGSGRTLTKGSDVLRPVLMLMKKEGWVETLPKNALQMYESPTPSSLSMTQASTLSRSS